MAVALKISYSGMRTQAGNISTKINDIYNLADESLFDTKKNEATAALTSFSEHKTSAFAALGDENAQAADGSVIQLMTRIGNTSAALRTMVSELTVGNYRAASSRRALEIAVDSVGTIKADLLAIQKAMGFA